MERAFQDLLHHIRRFAPGVFLAALVVAAFSNTFSVPFLLDDGPTIPGNASLRSLSAIGDVLFPPPDVYSAGRPLLNLSFALNYAIGGTAVGGYHFVNLAIHLAAAFAAYGLVRRIVLLPIFAGAPGGTSRIVALIVAAVWAVHPLQTASVTYISQRAESLMGLFYLLTLYGFLRGVQTGSAAWLATAIGLCAGGMLTKEVMITAPLVVFLIDWQWVSGTVREAWRKRWYFHLGMAATWLPLAGLMIASSLGKRAVGLGQGLSWFDYAQLECTAIVHYLRLVFWPDGLVFDYGANLPPPALGPLLCCGVILATLLLLTGFGLKQKFLWAAPLAVFFLLLAPTSSIVPVAGQPIAENRLYLPLLAIIGVTTIAVGKIFPRLGLWVLGGCAVALAGFTHARNHDFRSEVAIWSDTVAKRPHNQRAAVYLSEAYRSAGNPQAAIDTLLDAIRRNPNSGELHNNVAAAFATSGRPNEALPHLEAAIQLNPNLAAAHENYGAVLLTTGKVAPALTSLRRALALNPQSAGAHNFAGLCLLQLGELNAAAVEFETTLQLDPSYAAARTNLELVRQHIAQRPR